MTNSTRCLLVLIVFLSVVDVGSAQIITILPKRDTIMIAGVNANGTFKWSLVRTVGRVDTVSISPTKTSYIWTIGGGPVLWQRISFCIQDSTHQLTYTLLLLDSTAKPPLRWIAIPPDSETTVPRVSILKLLALRNSVAVDSASLRLGGGNVMDVESETLVITDALNQNYPNPFNPGTTISFELRRSQHVSVQIYNVLGRLVATLLSEKLNAGAHFYRWNAQGLPSGTYFCRLVGEDFRMTRRLQLLK